MFQECHSCLKGVNFVRIGNGVTELSWHDTVIVNELESDWLTDWLTDSLPRSGVTSYQYDANEETWTSEWHFFQVTQGQVFWRGEEGKEISGPSWKKGVRPL